MTDCPVRLATAAIMVPMIWIFTLVRGGFLIFGLFKGGTAFLDIDCEKTINISNGFSEEQENLNVQGDWIGHESCNY